MNFLYTIFISPIELLIEYVFVLMNRLFNNYGIAIVFVSLIVQILVLPLYKKADAIQDKEREKQKSMEKWVTHIRKTFKGDKRIMMLSTYYRQQNYKPYYVLKGSISLLLQVPFFIAAYHFLSNLEQLNGVSFLFISDLGKPDGIIKLFGLSINLLPILMTVINILAGMIYTKGFSFKEKLQLYLMALLFLVLLYTSPSGLVLYWTLNNLFSLIKNIFMKVVKKPKKTLNIPKSISKHLVLKDNKVFYLGCTLFVILAGVIIPSSVIKASPVEFISPANTPFGLIINTTLLYIGVFLVWINVYYLLISEKAKYILSCLIWVLFASAIVQFLFFGQNLGTITPTLVYDVSPSFSNKYKLVNIGIICIVSIGAILLFCLKYRITKYIMTILLIATSILATTNLISIQISLKNSNENKAYATHNSELVIPLSSSGKNVIVLMLDRAISGYIPAFIENYPKFLDMYDGFTYYPNTMSYGKITNLAAPALFGGYEYTPTKINDRINISLEEKNNEALLIMPTIFSNNGFTVTVADPPYAGYKWVPDLSIFDSYDDIKAFHTTSKYIDYYAENFEEVDTYQQKRSFFWYSILRVIPTMAWGSIYNYGLYNTTGTNISGQFLKEYATLLALPSITKVSEKNFNSALIMQNSTTHEASTAEAIGEIYTHSGTIPKIPEDSIKNIKTSNEMQKAHYRINLAALVSLGEWFDTLKEAEVYDNTKIIIVADHGRDLNQFDYMRLESKGIDVEAYNPLLLVKDFNSHGFKIDNKFMTNADVPSIAFDGIIELPINPFSKKEINNEDKFKHEQIITTSNKWDIETNNGNIFDTSDGKWFSVSENIFDENNWKLFE